MTLRKFSNAHCFYCWPIEKKNLSSLISEYSPVLMSQIMNVTDFVFGSGELRIIHVSTGKK